eukprot:629419-Pleurochrysis_carterae.AAC.1
MRPTLVRALAAIANSAGMRMRRWDFVAAYLQGDLEQDEVYCHAPPGYATIGADGRPRVSRAVKPIYGMAQAGRRWQRLLFPWFLKFGFKQCQSDPCVFTMTKCIGGVDQRIAIGCYVDDLFTLYTHDGETSLYAPFTEALPSRWNVEDDGPVSDLLNVDFSVDSTSVYLKQEKYIAHLVSAHLPDGIPLSFHETRALASRSLPKLVEQALLSRPNRSVDPKLLANYQSSSRCYIVRQQRGQTSPTQSACYAGP